MGKKELQLKTVTPKALRVLKETGLLENDSKTYTANLLSTYLDIGQLKSVCEACFEGDFSKIDFDEIDLEPISKGIRDFLLKALGGSVN